MNQRTHNQEENPSSPTVHCVLAWVPVMGIMLGIFWVLLGWRWRWWVCWAALCLWVMGFCFSFFFFFSLSPLLLSQTHSASQSPATTVGSPNPLGLIRVYVDLCVWIFDSAWILLSVGFWVRLNNQPCVMLCLVLLCVWIFGSTWIMLSIVVLDFG